MGNPNFTFQISYEDINGETANFFEAVKEKILEQEEKQNCQCFLRGPNKGFTLEVVHPNNDEKHHLDSLTVNIYCELFKV